MGNTLILLFFATLLLGVPVAFTMGMAGIAAIFWMAASILWSPRSGCLPALIPSR